MCKYCTPEAPSDYVPMCQAVNQTKTGDCTLFMAAQKKALVPHVMVFGGYMFSEDEPEPIWPINYCPMCGRKL